MKRIRLQIQVLPWDKARQDEVRPWTQPEDPENTLQRLVENITQRYGRIYVGRGALRVKELQDSWGSTLDLTDTVGDVFDDRSSSGDILTSICKVVRYPPNPAEISNPTRFTSLLPESSARPQKRPPPPLFRDAPRLLPSVEDTTDQGRQSAFAQPNKRRKVTREASTTDVDTRAVPLSQEQLHENQSQRRPTERQVLDSQTSPARNGNSYGTPNSLTSREPALGTQNTIHVVPDSPNNGRAVAVRRDRQRTKSESPELRLSVQEVAPTQEEIHQAQTPPSVARKTPNHDDLNHAAEPVIPAQQNETVGPQENPLATSPRPEDSARQISPLPSDLSGAQTSLGKSLTMLSDPPTFEASVHISSDAPRDTTVTGSIVDPEATNTRRTQADVFDPIESDSEGFQARQQMFPAKRLTLSKTPDKHGTITGRNLRTSASKSQLKGPKSNGFLLKTSKNAKQCNTTTGTDNGAVITRKPEQAGITRESSPKSTNDRESVPEALPPNSQAQPGPMPLEADIGADVLSQLATSEVSSPEKEDQRTEQSKPAHSSSFKAPDSSDDTNAHAINAPDHADEADGLPQTCPGDNDAESGASNHTNIQGTASAEADRQNPHPLSNGATKPLMGPPAIPNAYVEMWKKSSPAERTSYPDGMAIQTLSQGLQRSSSTSKNPTAQTAQTAKTTGADSSRELAMQEKRLADQAEKIMVANDGARQLQLEQAKLKQAANTAKANGWTVVDGVLQKPRTEKQEADQKRRQAQSAAARKFRETNPYVTSSPYEAGKTALVNGQGIPSSQLSSSQKIGSEGLSSSASNFDSMSSTKRRTLTPSHPPPTSSGVQQFSSPISSKSIASNALLLKSALKQPASNLRRSMSQVTFNESPSQSGVDKPVLNGASSSPLIPPPTSAPLKSTVNRIKSAKSAQSLPQPTAKTPRKGTTKATRKPTARKIQSTLKATRDAKQKGRISGPPVTKEVFHQDKSSISSSSSDDAVSSFISDEVVDVGISKAGPSSKQKPSSTRTPQPQKKSPNQRNTSSIKSSSPLPEAFSSSIDPALQALKPSASQSSGTTSNRISQSNHGSSQHAEEPTSGQAGTNDHSSGSESDLLDEPVLKGTKPHHEKSLGKAIAHHERLDSNSSPKASKSSKLRADGMLPNGMRPANFKYTSLSQLKREAQGKPHRPRVIQPKASNPVPSINPVDSESGSEEDESESDSDPSSDHIMTHKKKSGILAGARGLLKLLQSK